MSIIPRKARNIRPAADWASFNVSKRDDFHAVVWSGTKQPTIRKAYENACEVAMAGEMLDVLTDIEKELDEDARFSAEIDPPTYAKDVRRVLRRLRTLRAKMEA